MAWLKGLGVGTNFREHGVISLQYADDIILFSVPDEEQLKNLKGTLAWFEHISGMRINFNKSELIPINLEQDDLHRIAHIF